MYVATSRETKRLDSIAQSPIFSNFGETLQVLRTLLPASGLNLGHRQTAWPGWSELGQYVSACTALM